jgi:hypothetical protein
LKIFLDTEAQVFAERFESAAAHISEELGNLEESLSSTIRSMSDQLGWADSNIDDTARTMDTILAYAKHTNDETNDVAARLRALFRQDARKDPVRDREFDEVIKSLVEQISGDKKLKNAVLSSNGRLSYELNGKPALELTVEDGQAALAEATKIVRQKEDLKNYQLSCLAPGDAAPETVAAIVAAMAKDEDVGALGSAIAGAFRIAFTTYKGAVVAVSGLRKPRLPVRTQLFAQAGTAADPKKYKVQLDWIYLHPDHHKKGRLTKLLDKLLAEAGKQPLFALVRSDDELAVAVLAQYKFSPTGTAGFVLPGTGIAMQLFLRVVA